LVTVALVVDEHPLMSVTVTLYVPAERPLAVTVVAPVDHEYVYGPVPPLSILAVAVPLLNNGQVACVESVEITRAHGGEHATEGWKPLDGSLPASVLFDK
jgi:hypothetical protein